MNGGATHPTGPGLRAKAASTVADFFRVVDSPLGRILLAGNGTAISALVIERDGVLPFDKLTERSTSVLDNAASQLEEYFAGSRTRFEVPLALNGSAFQMSVWGELTQLPFGSVLSYGQIGAMTGRASAGRAVGGAVGANPVPIIVPCHRVLAANKRITGYSAGNGIATKAWLLTHEGVEHRA